MAAPELEEAELVAALVDKPTDKPIISAKTLSTTRTIAPRIMYFCTGQKSKSVYIKIIEKERNTFLKVNLAFKNVLIIIKQIL